MAIDLPSILAASPLVTEGVHTAHDTILYALAIGAGQDPQKMAKELPYVYRPQCAFPTQAFVLAYPSDWLRRPEYGLTWSQAVLLGVQLTAEAPLPPEGSTRSTLTVEGVEDRGSTGALITTRRELQCASTGKLLAVIRQLTLCRADGGSGSGGSAASRLDLPPSFHPDRTVRVATRPEQALVYRLCGDLNPLHADPMVARRAGFERPILHGLCTLGIVARTITLHDPEVSGRPLTGVAARFTGRVLPGETLEIELQRPARDDTMVRVTVVETGRPALICRMRHASS